MNQIRIERLSRRVENLGPRYAVAGQHAAPRTGSGSHLDVIDTATGTRFVVEDEQAFDARILADFEAQEAQLRLAQTEAEALADPDRRPVKEPPL